MLSRKIILLLNQLEYIHDNNLSRIINIYRVEKLYVAEKYLDAHGKINTQVLRDYSSRTENLW